MNSLISLLINGIFLILNLSSVYAQTDDMVTLEQYHAEQVEKDLIEVHMTFFIKNGLHIQSHENGDEYMIPTKIDLETDDCYSLQGINFPKAIRYAALSQENEYGIHKGRMETKLLIRLECESMTSKSVIGSLYYQACAEGKCYFPRTLVFKIDIDQINFSGS